MDSQQPSPDRPVPMATPCGYFHNPSYDCEQCRRINAERGQQQPSSERPVPMATPCGFYHDPSKDCEHCRRANATRAGHSGPQPMPNSQEQQSLPHPPIHGQSPPIHGQAAPRPPIHGQAVPGPQHPQPLSYAAYQGQAGPTHQTQRSIPQPSMAQAPSAQRPRPQQDIDRPSMVHACPQCLERIARGLFDPPCNDCQRRGLHTLVGYTEPPPIHAYLAQLAASQAAPSQVAPRQVCQECQMRAGQGLTRIPCDSCRQRGVHILPQYNNQALQPRVPAQVPQGPFGVAQPCEECEQTRRGRPSCPDCEFCEHDCRSCARTYACLHKVCCDKYMGQIHPRPDNSVLAIYIPQTGAPEFQWVRIDLEDDYALARPDLTAFLGAADYDRSLHTYAIGQVEVLGHELRMYRLKAPQAKNEFLANLMKGSSRERQWGGPVVILACELAEKAVDNPTWRNAEVRDLSWMYYYWRNGDEPPLSPTGLPVNGGRGATGNSVWSAAAVVINCDAEMSTDRTLSRFVGVPITANHPIWKQSPMPISRQMRIPLLMYKFPVQVVTPMMPITHPAFDNLIAKAMNRVIDVDNRGWGWPIPEYRQNCGTVLIARADQRDLSVQVASLIAQYHCNAVETVMQSCQSMPQLKAHQTLLEGISLADYESFVNMMRATLVPSDPIWLQAGSPYVVQGQDVADSNRLSDIQREAEDTQQEPEEIRRGPLEAEQPPNKRRRFGYLRGG